jgi:hypothetical protein
MVSAFVQVPRVTGGTEFRANVARVASRLHVFRLDVEGHGVLVPRGVGAVRAAKPRAARRHFGKGENPLLDFLPQGAYRLERFILRIFSNPCGICFCADAKHSLMNSILHTEDKCILPTEHALPRHVPTAESCI